MQPDGPYRFTETMGVCLVGKAWWAVDGQGRPVTVAVLEGAAAADQRWREAFANAAEAMSKAATGPRYERADFSASYPWVAYPSEGGLGAQHLFRALGMELHPEPGTPPSVTPTTGPSAPVSLPSQQASPQPEPSQPVSAPPQPVSSPPQPAVGPTEPVSAPPQPVSVPPQPISVPPQPVSVPPQSVSAPPSVGGERQPWPAVTSPVPEPWSADPAPYDPFSAPVRRIQPSPPPKRRTGLWVAITALVLAVVLGGGVAVWAIAFRNSTEPTDQPTAGPTNAPSASPVNPGLKPWAHAPLYSPEERALATVAPSMVFIEVIFTGHLRNKQDNALLRPTPVTFSRRCSGFVVNQDGHVLTNGQCVRPTQEILLSGALSALGNLLVREGALNAKDLGSYTATRMKTTLFTGSEPTTEPEAKLYGQLNTAKGDVTDSPAIPGTVVQTQVLDEGNLALVKLAQGGLPVAELNTSAIIGPETPLVVIGYHTSDTTFRSATYMLQTKKVTVTEVDTQSPVNPYRINDEIGVYSRGGIAIDPTGRVVGMLDNDMLRSDRANRLVAPVSAMTGLLGAAGVQNGLGEADKLYRSGLEAYFARDHDTAVSRFNEVVEKSPTNLLAQQYRQMAVDSGGGKNGSSGWPGWVVALLAAAGGAVAVGIIVTVVVLVRRRSNRLA